MARALDYNDPSGTPVCVRLDDGTTRHTVTRSLPERMHNEMVVWLKGIAGCYLASRCTVIEAEREVHDGQ